MYLYICVMYICSGYIFTYACWVGMCALYMYYLRTYICLYICALSCMYTCRKIFMRVYVYTLIICGLLGA